MKRAVEQMGVRRTARRCCRLNQVDGFDCQGCAWPDPDAGAPAHRRVLRERRQGGHRGGDPAPPRPATSSPRTRGRPRGQDRLLAGPAGPDHRADGAAGRGHALRADRLGRRVRAGRRPPARPGLARTRRCSTPRARRPTRRRSSTSCSSGRFGTNNLPDCSNMCHESTSVALAETIGIGKGSVSLDDVHTRRADRDRRPEPRHQPPADAHRARDRQEERRPDHRDQPAARGRAGAVQEPADAARRGRRAAPPLADLHLPVRVNGDLALFQAIGVAAARVGRRRPRLRRAAHHAASRSGPRTSRELDWDAVDARDRPRPRAQIEEAAGDVPGLRGDHHLLGDGHHPAPQRGRHDQGVRQRRPAAGQHRQARAPGCARCAATPTCRATGPWASGSGPSRRSSTRCATSSASSPPREHGFDTVEAVQALARRPGAGVLRDGRQLRLGGLRHRRHRGGDAQRRPHRARLHQAEPVARRHRPRGADPPGPRPQRARPDRRPRAAGHRRGLDVGGARLAGPARAGLGRTCAPRSTSSARSPRPRSGDRARHPVGRLPRRLRARSGSASRSVVPGCAAYDEKVDQPGGFVLPHPPRDSRDFPTDDRPGGVLGQPDRRAGGAGGAAAPADAALARPVQHHDLRPRRPLPRHQGRPPGRLRAPRRHRRTSASPTATWSTWSASGTTAPSGRATEFRIVAYDQPRGCAAAYYPETNALVPLDSTAEGSNTPTSKSVVVRLERPGGRRTGVVTAGEGHETGHKRQTDPSASADRATVTG